MPKAISAGLLAHNQSDSTTLATLWKIIRTDGKIFTFTDLDNDIVFDDGTGKRTYLASDGFSPSAIEVSSELAVDNMEVAGVLSQATITEADLFAGLWDAAEVCVYRVNYMDLSMGLEWINRGTIGAVSTGRNAFKAELRGQSQALQQQRSKLVLPQCNANFCDTRCKLNKADFTFSGAITGVTSQQTFDTDFVKEPGYFMNGVVKFTSGANAGLSMEVKFFGGAPNYTILTQTSAVSGGVIHVSVPAGKVFSRDYGCIDSTGLTYKLSETPSETGSYEPGSGGVYFFNSADEGKVITITYALQDYGVAPAGQFDLQLEMPYPIAVGDTVEALAGCDKLLQTCSKKFNNVINMRAFPHLPGRDRLLSGNS